MNSSQSPFRSFLAGLLGTLGVLLIPVTLIAQWTQNYLLNTENFVALYQPLSGKASFQQYLASELSGAAAQAVEDSGLADMAGSITGSIDGFLGNFGVDLGLEEATSNWTHQLSDLVGETVYEEALPALQSPQFAEAWTVAVTQVHSQLVAGLLEDGPETQTLTLQGGPFVAIIQDYLGDRGFSIAKQLPPLAVDAEIPLVEVTYAPAWRTFITLLVQYGNALPWVAGGLIIASVLVARKPWAALARAGFASAFITGVLWLVIPAFGKLVLRDVATTAAEGSLASLLWDMGATPLLSQSILVVVVSAGVGALGLVIHLLVGSYRR